VLLQQSLNHYQPGNEGWIDVAWSAEANPSSDDNFTVLARIEDVYEHMQAKQTNYSIPITVRTAINFEEAKWRRALELFLSSTIIYIGHLQPPMTLPFNGTCEFRRIIIRLFLPRRHDRSLARLVCSPAVGHWSKVPNVDLKHGVLRVRYHPNKPTEPVFHNCADISIMATKPAETSLLFAVAEPAQPLLSPNSRQAVVRVAGNGSLQTYLEVAAPWRLVMEVVTDVTATSCFIAQEAVKVFADDTPPPLTLLCLSSGSWLPIPLDFSTVLDDPASGVVSALTAGPGGMVLAVLQVMSANGYAYMLVQIDATGKASPPFNLPKAPVSAYETTFVNFMWADHDPKSFAVFILAGDENSLFALNAVVHTFGYDGTVKTVPLDNSAFALQHLHWHAQTGTLLALSPGLFTAAAQASAWSLVSVDPATGKVALLHPLSLSPGTRSNKEAAAIEHFDADFGGSVHNPFSPPDGATMTHVLRRSVDKTHVVIKVDVATGTFEASSLQAGVNNAYRVGLYFSRAY